MPPPKQQRRRALELLEASIDGCTEAIMLAYGFKTELLVELVNAGLATATIDRMVVGGAPGQSHPHADYCGWPAGAREASMALIPKRASASRHRCHSDPAILRYALKGTSKPRHVRGFLLVVTRCHSRKFDPARIRAVRENQSIIRCDVCDYLPAWNIYRRSVQVAAPA